MDSAISWCCITAQHCILVFLWLSSGYPAAYAQDPCGPQKPANLTDPSGVITTPGYGGGTHYQPNLNCAWELQAALGEVITLDFYDFDVEYCHWCSCDCLEIRNGIRANSTLIGRYNDDVIPPQIKSSVSSLELRFASDESQEGRGFFIVYKFINLAEKACGNQTMQTTLTYQPGDILSPNYGGYYPDNSSCRWLIQAPYDKAIVLTFLFLDVEYGYECEFDSVAIYDGNTDNAAALMVRACGRQLPDPLISSTFHVLITFVSDNEIHGRHFRGFHLQFSYVDNPSSYEFPIVAIVCISVAIVAFFTLITAYCILARKQKILYSEELAARQGFCPRGPSSANRTRFNFARDQAAIGLGDMDIYTLPPPYEPREAAVNCQSYAPPTYEEALGHDLVAQSEAPPTIRSNGNENVSSQLCLQSGVNQVSPNSERHQQDALTLACANADNALRDASCLSPHPTICASAPMTLLSGNGALILCNLPISKF